MIFISMNKCKADASPVESEHRASSFFFFFIYIFLHFCTLQRGRVVVPQTLTSKNDSHPTYRYYLVTKYGKYGTCQQLIPAFVLDVPYLK